MRAIVHLLSISLFGESLPIHDFPRRQDLDGIGLSDWSGYSSRLRERIPHYTNTFYDREPLLDVTQPSEHWLPQDFLISSDVFEHVRPPVSRAFAGARRLLKPDGVLILSVPFVRKPVDTIEHFPTLHDYAIVEECGQMVLRNRRPDGTVEVFNQLIFHGGEGTTMEFRLFSESSLCRELHNAGFRRIEVFRRSIPEWGIYWLEPWSVPLLARP